MLSVVSYILKVSLKAPQVTIPATFELAEVFEGEYEPSINSAVNSQRPTRSGRDDSPGKFSMFPEPSKILTYLQLISTRKITIPK